MHDSIQTVIVTDVPFWAKESGAHLRIDQLAENLSRAPFETSVLLTQAPVELDVDGIQCRMPVKKLDPSTPPQSGTWAKIKWQMAAIANLFGWRPRPHEATFQSYYPEFIVNRFKDVVLTTGPDVLVFEYATQTQLLRSLPDSIRKNIVTILDTHDVLWKRAQQFEQNGHEHWIAVEQEEEESAIREYDLVLAIQGEEARYFKSLVGEDRVMVTSMEFDTQSMPSIAEGADSNHFAENRNSELPKDRIVIGYLASNNWTNVDAALQIIECWPDIAKEMPHIELLIAGSVCKAQSLVDVVANLPQMKIIGRVDRAEDFYHQVDLIWNPVRYGTGLKIKNLEALAHAKCLVTSPHGSEGMGGNTIDQFEVGFDSGQGQGPIIVLPSPTAMGTFLRGQDSSLIRHLGQLGQKHLEKNFGLGTQYPRLRQKIGALLSEKME